MAPVSTKEFLDIQATIACRFTLKRDMIIVDSPFGVFINFLYIYLYINYIIHCKIKKDNPQLPKIIRVPGNKTNPKKGK